MRTFLVVLASSLLLSPVAMGTKIHPIHDMDESSSHGTKVVRISVNVDGHVWEADSSDSCQHGDENCHSTAGRQGFRCGKKFFSQDKVIAAGQAACPKISSNAQNNRFPAPYYASEFKKDGPYVQWPVNRNGKIWNSFSEDKHRLVMTMDCTVVGAVVRQKSNTYYSCDVERH